VKCVYPVTFEYAKALMIMYVPWSNKNNLKFTDKLATVTEFERLIASNSFPTSVIAQYKRAEFYHKHNKIEVISKKSIPVNLDQDKNHDEYSDYQIYVRTMNHFTSDKPVPSSIGDMSFNIGLNYDWTQTSASHICRSMTRPGESFIEWIKEKYKQEYSTEFEHDVNRNDKNKKLVRTFEFSHFLLVLYLILSFVFLA
jgi:hypothetical protein